MKFKLALSILFISSVALASHTKDRSIYATDITTASGTSIFKFPTSLATANTVCTFNGDSEPVSSAVTTTTLGLLNTATSNATASTLVERDSNVNFQVNIEDQATQAIAVGSSVTLTGSSPGQIRVTGGTSSNQTIVLPDATTLPVGRTYTFYNQNTGGGIITVNKNGGASSGLTVAKFSQGWVKLTDNATAAGTWLAGPILLSGNILVGGSVNTAQPVAMSQDATISNSGAVSVNNFRYADGSRGTVAALAELLYPSTGNILAESGFLHYPNGNAMASTLSLNYPDGTILTDVNGQIYWNSASGGNTLIDSSGDLFYSGGDTLADSGGSLWLSGGLVDISGSTIIDNSHSFYGTGGLILDGTSNVLKNTLDGNISVDVGNRILTDQLNASQLSWTTAGVQIPNKVSSYNGSTTDGAGMTSIVKRVSLTVQGASITGTTLFAPPVVGEYRISVYAVTTTAGSAGTLSVSLTWNDSTQAQTNTPVSGMSLTSLGAYAQGSVFIHSNGSTAFQYSTTVSGATGSPKYSLFVIAERLN